MAAPVSTDPADTAVDGLTAAIDDLLTVPTGCLTGPEARTSMVAVLRQQRRLEAVQVRLAAASIAADTVLTGNPGQARARVVNALADQHLARGTAGALVDAVPVLDPVAGDLREVGTALAAGDTSMTHVTIAVRALTRIPAHLRREHRADIAATVLDAVTGWAPRDVTTLTRRVLDHLTPRAADRFDPAAHERRTFHLATDSTGMVITTGQHDPAAGAYLTAVLGAMAHRDRPVPCTGSALDADPGSPSVGVMDTRSPAMRRHDALHELVRAGADSLARGDTTGRIGAALARVTIITGPDALTPDPGSEDAVDTTRDPGHGTDDQDVDVTALPEPATIPGHGTLSPGLLQRLACDAVLDHLVRDRTGRVVSLRTTGRLATPAIVRALIARDGGCALPGCTRPPSVCDAHHVIWWTHGGPTTTDNLVLLCSHHHTTIHTGDWTVRMRDGVPWFRPPGTTTWHRNSSTDALHRADLLGTRLRHALTQHRRATRPSTRWPAAGS